MSTDERPARSLRAAGQRYHVVGRVGGGRHLGRVRDAWLGNRLTGVPLAVPDDPPARARLLELCTFCHPNVVQVADIVPAGAGRLLVLCQALPEQTVLSWGGRERRLRSLLSLALSAGLGVAYLHAVTGRGHGRLSPAAVRVRSRELGGACSAMVAPSEIVSGLVENQRMEAPHVDPSAYQGPEWRQGGSPSTAEDVFALGTMLLELLTGRRDRSQLSTLASAMPGDSKTAQDVAALLERMLARVPNHRPALADVLRELEIILGQANDPQPSRVPVRHPNYPSVIGGAAFRESVDALLARVVRGEVRRIAASLPTVLRDQVLLQARCFGLRIVFAADPFADFALHPRVQATAARWLWVPDPLPSHAPGRLAHLAERVERDSLGATLYSDERLPPLDAEFALISRPRLSLRDAEQLVASRMAEPEAPAWARWAHDVTGGDPVRIAAITDAQLGAGARLTLTVPTAPEELAAFAMARIPAESRPLCQLIALSPWPVPRALLGKLNRAVALRLPRLARGGWLRLTASGASIMTPELAEQLVGELAEDTRRTLHGQLATLWSSSTGVDPARVGYHLACAGEYAAAARVLAQGREALPAVTRQVATELLAEACDRSAIVLVPSLAHYLRRRGQPKVALAIAAALANRAPRAGALLRAELHIDMGQPDRAREALAAAGAAPSGSEASIVALLECRSALLGGDPLGARERALPVLAATAPTDPTHIAALNVLALTESRLGEQSRALVHAERAAALARETSEPLLLARALNSVAGLCQQAGDSSRARDCYEQSIAGFEAQGETGLAATATMSLATLLHAENELGDALSLYRSLAVGGEGCVPETTLCWSMLNEANLRLLCGHLRGAATLLARVRHLSMDLGARTLLGHALVVEAELHTASGELEDVLPLLDQARCQFDRHDSTGRQAVARIAFGHAMLTMDMDAARTAFAVITTEEPTGPLETFRRVILRAELALAERGAADLDAVIHALGKALDGAPPSGLRLRWQAEGLLALVHDCTGSSLAAERAHERFLAAVAALRAQVPAAYRRHFDARSDLCAMRERLATLAERAQVAVPLSRVECLLDLGGLPGAASTSEEIWSLAARTARELTYARRVTIVRCAQGQVERVAEDGLARLAGNASDGGRDLTLARAAFEGTTPPSALDSGPGGEWPVGWLRRGRTVIVPLGPAASRLSAPDGTPRLALAIELAGSVDRLSVDGRKMIELVSRELGELALAEKQHLAAANELDQQRSAHQLLAVRCAQQEALIAELREHSCNYEAQISALLTELGSQHGEHLLAGSSPAAASLRRAAERLGACDGPVLVSGPPGSGTRALAAAIHRRSARRDQPLILFACGEVPHVLQATDLFGDCGARRSPRELARIGRLGLAGRGSLVLHGASRLAPAIQMELTARMSPSAFGEDGAARLAASPSVPLSCRLIITVHTGDGATRAADLLSSAFGSAIGSLRIDVPPLATRPQDLPEIATRMLDSRCRLSAAAQSALCRYPWPGNLDELAVVLEATRSFAGPLIELHHLPPHISLVAESAPADSLDEALRRHERRLIEFALSETNHNVTETARRLKLSRAMLHRKLRVHGIERSAKRPHKSR